MYGKLKIVFAFSQCKDTLGMTSCVALDEIVVACKLPFAL